MDYINLAITIVYGVVTLILGVYVYRLGRKEGINSYLAAIEDDAVEIDFDDLDWEELNKKEPEAEEEVLEQEEEYVEPSYDDLVDIYVEEQKEKGINLTAQQIADLKNVEEIT